MTPTVTTTGRAELELDAEIAAIVFALRAHRPTRAAALEELTGRWAALDRLVSALGDALEERIDAPVVIDAKYKWSRDRQRLDGYVATRETRLLLHDWSGLAELMVGAAEEVEASIAGPSWHLRPTNPVYDEAKVAAAAAARARAEAYCRGLGVTLGPVLRITEAGFTELYGEVMERRVYRAIDGLEGYAFGELGGGSEPHDERPKMPFGPRRIRVEAKVKVTLGLIDPTA
jgi:uncharacterized protein YggE